MTFEEIESIMHKMKVYPETKRLKNETIQKYLARKERGKRVIANKIQSLVDNFKAYEKNYELMKQASLVDKDGEMHRHYCYIERVLCTEGHNIRVALKIASNYNPGKPEKGGRYGKPGGITKFNSEVFD